MREAISPQPVRSEIDAVVGRNRSEPRRSVLCFSLLRSIGFWDSQIDAVHADALAPAWDAFPIKTAAPAVGSMILLK